MIYYDDMISTTELIKERIVWLRNLKPILRALDGRIEAAEREVKRLLNRRKALLEPDDVKNLSTKVADISKELQKATAYVKKGFKR